MPSACPYARVPFAGWNPKQAALERGESATLHRLAQAPIRNPSAPVVSLFHVFPHHYRRVDGAAYHIGRTMCETDRIPEEWVGQCNAMDEIWVPCDHNVECFARSGVERRKLVRMPQGINLDRYRAATPPMHLPGGRRFNFLSVFEWSRRKGWDVLVRAFAAEFRPSENIALIIKTGASGSQSLGLFRQAVIAELRAARLGWNQPPNIILFPMQPDCGQMPALYRGANAFVLPSRGEGWGRPADGGDAHGDYPPSPRAGAARWNL